MISWMIRYKKWQICTIWTTRMTPRSCHSSGSQPTKQRQPTRNSSSARPWQPRADRLPQRAGNTTLHPGSLQPRSPLTLIATPAMLPSIQVPVKSRLCLARMPCWVWSQWMTLRVFEIRSTRRFVTRSMRTQPQKKMRITELVVHQGPQLQETPSRLMRSVIMRLLRCMRVCELSAGRFTDIFWYS